MPSNTRNRVNNSFLSIMNSMPLPGSKFAILLGFSGGADSSALLNLLDMHKESFGYTLFAVHVNHMIRANEADRDELFCQKRCKELGVELFCYKYDVPAIAGTQKNGLEETARNIRYSVFKQTAENITGKTGMPVLIATAHNADDNVETVLFNITRGTALTGVCGIKKHRENIIRPIILSPKSDIYDYCKENGIEYINDSTNLDTNYNRNKIRNLVLPLLKEINPSLSSAVTRMTDSLTLDNQYLSEVSEKFILENYENGKIDLSLLNHLHPSIKTRVIYSLLKINNATDLLEVHVRAVDNLSSRALSHSRLDLPCNLTVSVESGMLVFDKKKPLCETVSFNLPFIYGTTKIEQTGDIVARFHSDDKENIEKFKNIYKKFIQAEITSATIKGALLLRTRKPGDIFNINGINRKLKKVLWEIESDPKKRNKLPIICDDCGILWVPGTRSRTNTFPKNNESSQIFFYVSSDFI